MELNVEKIEAAAAGEVADRIFHEGNIQSKLDAMLAARIDKFFLEIADRRIGEAVDRAVADGFDHEYTKIDSFGRGLGTPTTIRKELEKTVQNYWSAPVDSNGKPDTNSYGTKTTRAQYVMVQMVGKDFGDKLKELMVAATAHLKDGFRAEMRKWVDSSLGELFHVRSQQDQAEGRYK